MADGCSGALVRRFVFMGVLSVAVLARSSVALAQNGPGAASGSPPASASQSPSASPDEASFTWYTSSSPPPASTVQAVQPVVPAVESPASPTPSTETEGTSCGAVGAACCEGQLCGSDANCVDRMCVAAVACRRDSDCAATEECTTRVCHPRAPASRFLVEFGAGLSIDSLPNVAAVTAGSFDVAFAGRPLILGRRQPWELSLITGVEARIGSWRSYVVGDATFSVGARFSLGRVVGFDATLLYTPGFIAAEGRLDGVYKSYRFAAAFHYRRLAFGLSWQEMGRGANTPYRNLGVFAEVGF